MYGTDALSAGLNNTARPQDARSVTMVTLVCVLVVEAITRSRRGDLGCAISVTQAGVCPWNRRLAVWSGLPRATSFPSNRPVAARAPALAGGARKGLRDRHPGAGNRARNREPGVEQVSTLCHH